MGSSGTDSHAPPGPRAGRFPLLLRIWDFNKNVTEAFDGDGRIAAAYDYSPYGQAASTGSLVQPVQWSGEMHDDDFALVYYNYHYYNPKDGR